MQVIDNTNLLQICRDCGAVGFLPVVTYVYDAEAGTVTITNDSTIPSGDALRVIKIKVHDFFGAEVRGHISGSPGGEGYESAPAVAFSGGGGTGAEGTAVIANGKVTGVTIDEPGSSYETAPTVAFTGGGGTGAAGTVVLDGDAVDSVTIDADDTTAVLDVSSLNRSKQLAITVEIHTTGQIAADGGAYGLMAAGDISHWDVQKNA